MKIDLEKLISKSDIDYNLSKTYSYFSHIVDMYDDTCKVNEAIEIEKTNGEYPQLYPLYIALALSGKKLDFNHLNTRTVSELADYTYSFISGLNELDLYLNLKKYFVNRYFLLYEKKKITPVGVGILKGFKNDRVNFVGISTSGAIKRFENIGLNKFKRVYDVYNLDNKNEVDRLFDLMLILEKHLRSGLLRIQNLCLLEMNGEMYLGKFELFDLQLDTTVAICMCSQFDSWVGKDVTFPIYRLKSILFDFMVDEDLSQTFNKVGSVNFKNNNLPSRYEVITYLYYRCPNLYSSISCNYLGKWEEEYFSHQNYAIFNKVLSDAIPEFYNLRINKRDAIGDLFGGITYEVDVVPEDFVKYGRII